MDPDKLDLDSRSLRKEMPKTSIWKKNVLKKNGLLLEWTINGPNQAML